VLEHQVRLAESSGKARLARWWLEGSRSRRIILGGGTIVLPAAVVGLGVGAVVATLGLPTLAVVGVGFGITFAGRQIGGSVAKSVNRHRAATATGKRLLAERSRERITQFANHYQRPAITKQNLLLPEWNDISVLYEERTQEEQAENARRLKTGRMLGSLAAGGGFLVGSVAAHAVQAAHLAHVSGQHVSAATTIQIQHAPTAATAPQLPPAPHIPPAPHGLTHMYPWDAATQWNQAHHLSGSSGNVWKTLHHAAAAYNQAHGTHFGYVLHANGTYWLQNGAQQLTASQHASFNTFLWNLPAA